MKKIILHIGCEKTGTTSIQNTIFSNKQLLEKAYGILYPRSLGGKNHWKLAVYACDEDKNLTRLLPKGLDISQFRQGLREEFIKEVKNSDADIIIISNEWLHPRVRSEAEFNRLKRLLSAVSNDIEVLMYIRQQDKMAISLYSTSLRAGNIKPFSFPKSVKLDSLPYYYDFLSIYRNWKHSFGTGKIKLRLFQQASLYKSDVVDDFFHCLDINNAAFKRGKSHNFSINNRGVKLMRLLNWVLKHSELVIKQNLARLLRHKLADSFRGKAYLATELECVEFLSFFDVSNEQLKREYEEDTSSLIGNFTVRKN